MAKKDLRENGLLLQQWSLNEVKWVKLIIIRSECTSQLNSTPSFLSQLLKPRPHFLGRQQEFFLLDLGRVFFFAPHYQDGNTIHRLDLILIFSPQIF